MNKKVLVLLLGGGAFYFLWTKYLSNQATSRLGPNQQLGAKPGNTVGSNRQDNANQPWYVGIVKGAVSSEASKYKSNPTQALKDVGSVVHSISDVWGEVSAWWGSDSSTDNTQTAIEVDAMPNTDNNISLPGSGEWGSNIFGDMLSDSDSPITSTDLSLDNTDFGMVDSVASDNYFDDESFFDNWS